MRPAAISHRSLPVGLGRDRDDRRRRGRRRRRRDRRGVGRWSGRAELGRDGLLGERAAPSVCTRSCRRRPESAGNCVANTSHRPSGGAVPSPHSSMFGERRHPERGRHVALVDPVDLERHDRRAGAAASSACSSPVNTTVESASAVAIAGVVHSQAAAAGRAGPSVTTSAAKSTGRSRRSACGCGHGATLADPCRPRATCRRRGRGRAAAGGSVECARGASSEPTR